jgi:RNA polymerase sigma-70 factor (ECF subfamily)
MDVEDMGGNYMDAVHEEDLPRLLASDLNRYFPSLDKIYRERLLAYALKLARNQEDAEDVVQETFRSAFEALASRSAEQVESIHLWPWLCRIAHNSFVTMLRKKRKIQLFSYDTQEGRLFFETQVDTFFEAPEISFENHESLQKLYELLKGLPSKYRTAVVYRRIMRFRYTHIASLLGISVKEAKERVTYGLKQLRNAGSVDQECL